MKKKDRIHSIYEKAPKLAKTGDYVDWRNIEFKLRCEGLIEAKEFLEKEGFREELNDLCNKARSKEEIQNRESFNLWLINFIESNRENIYTNFPKVKIYVNQSHKYFSMFAEKKGYEISKMFCSKKLIGDVIFEEENGKKIKSFNSYQSSKNFDDFTIKDLEDLAKNISN